MLWTLLIVSMPTESTTARMRAWRALKACGAAVLRDGVYLVPATASTQASLASVGEDVLAHGGLAYQLALDSVAPYDFEPLFDRSTEFATWMLDVQACGAQLKPDNALECVKAVRKLRKSFGQLCAIDFFAGEAQKQAAEALVELEAKVHQALSPNEPVAAPAQAIPMLDRAEYLGRTWATRSRPWADRLACAWLVKRHIDSGAKILWLNSPEECPADALGFDFDGARFSHVGAKVSFEVLLASFAWNSPAWQRLGALVHYLDVGGIEPPEAAGIERVLAGLCTAFSDDDQLLTAASAVFDGLLASFEKETKV